MIGGHTVAGQAAEFEHRLDRMETRFDPFSGAEDFTASWSDSRDLNQLTLPNGAKIAQAYDGAARLTDRTVKVGTTIMSGGPTSPTTTTTTAWTSRSASASSTARGSDPAPRVTTTTSSTG